MGQLKQTGTFLFDILEGCVCATQSGLPQWVAQLQAVQSFDEDSEQWIDYSEYEDRDTTAYLCLFGKDGKALLNAKQLMKAVKWSGNSFEELDQMDYSGIQIQGRMDENEYNGKTTIRINWIDSADADPRRTLTRLDADALKKLNAKFSTGIRELSGGPKPKSVSAPILPKPPVEKSEKKEPEKPKTEKPKKPSIPKPSTKKEQEKSESPGIVTQTESQKTLSETCTQEEAWETCAKLRKPDISDDDLANIWIQVIGDLGGDEMIGDNWAKVRDGVLDTINQ